MNQEKIGLFIQQMRKEKNWTQKDLAEKLGISDKTVSKWETGKGLPDIASLNPLCDILEININELLSGEKISEQHPDAYSEKAEENMMYLLKENQVNRKNKIANILVGGILAIISLLFLFMSTFGSESLFAYFIDLPSSIEIVLICAAAVILSGAKGKTEIVGLLRKIVLPVGLFISIFGAIIIITHETEPRAILANMSIDLLALFYSILIYIILCVVSYKD